MITLNSSWQTIATRTVTKGGATITFHLDAKINSQDLEGNFSWIGTRLRSTLANQRSISGSGYSFELSGATTRSGSDVWYFANETILEGSYKVQHANDGTATTAPYAFAWNSYWGISEWFNTTVALPRINRFCLLQTAPSFTDEENPTITFSNYGDFTIRATIGSTTSAIITREITDRTLTSYTFELTEEERNQLRALTPNDNNMTVRFNISAIDAEGTKKNDSYLDRSLMIINANPTYTVGTKETIEKVISALETDDANKIVKNASVVRVTITPTAKKGATIKSVELKHNGIIYTKTTAPYTFDVPVQLEGFGVVVTDSRENAYAGVFYKTLIDYIPVQINNVTFERKNPTSSDLYLTADITYKTQTFGTKSNTPTIKWKIEEAETWNTLTASDYTIDSENNKITINKKELTNVVDYRERKTLILNIADLLTESQDKDDVLKGIPTFDYGEHDLKVNGDLFIADINGENPVNVLNKLNEGEIYSTAEQLIGKTADGKDLYKKTVIFTSGWATGATRVLSHNINYSELIDVSMTALRGATGYTNKPTTLYYGALPASQLGWVISTYDFTKTGFTIYVGTNQTGSNALTKLTATFKYAK